MKSAGAQGFGAVVYGAEAPARPTPADAVIEL